MTSPESVAADAARQRLSHALSRVGDGDRAALRQVYDLTSAKLFGICLRICGDRAVAEDVMQDVYIKVWQRAGRFDAERGSPITWLATIARNAALDWRRSPAARPTESDDVLAAVADPSPDAEALVIAAGTGSRITRCLGELEKHEAGAIRSAFYDGSSYPELAARAKVPLGTMKSWIRRALIKLRECIGDG